MTANDALAYTSNGTIHDAVARSSSAGQPTGMGGYNRLNEYVNEHLNEIPGLQRPAIICSPSHGRRVTASVKSEHSVWLCCSCSAL